MSANNKSMEGVINPSGLFMGSFALLYIVFVPVVSFLTSPGGLVEGAVKTALSALIPGTVRGREIVALAALYTFAAYPASGALSVAGQASARKAFDNNHPRQHTSQLRGLPLRLYSAHQNLMETFPMFAAAAALAQGLAPQNQHIINLLGMHVLLKVFVFYPSYVFDVSATRSLSHLLSLSSAFTVVWKLARGA